DRFREVSSGSESLQSVIARQREWDSRLITNPFPRDLGLGPPGRLGGHRERLQIPSTSEHKKVLPTCSESQGFPSRLQLARNFGARTLRSGRTDLQQAAQPLPDRPASRTVASCGALRPLDEDSRRAEAAS